jgi:hypothetical protein
MAGHSGGIFLYKVVYRGQFFQVSPGPKSAFFQVFQFFRKSDKITVFPGPIFQVFSVFFGFFDLGPATLARPFWST